MSLIESLVIFVVRRLVPKRAYPILAGPLRGKRFILGAAAGPAGGLSIFVGRSEPEQTLAMAAALGRGDVLFDVGANVGYYTLLASERVGAAGRVIAFEPVVRNLSFLHRHLELNGAANVTVLPFACTRESGYGFFQTGDTVATGHLAGGSGPREEWRDRATPVHLTTVDATVRLLGFSPTVMKIDVEGAEHDVLLGAADTLRVARPRIFLSIHSDRLRADCLALLRGHGYDAAPLGGSLESATEYLLTPAARTGHPDCA